MNIYKKLMLSLVGLTSIILIATLLLARWSFEQGFNNFLQAQEIDRLGRISQEIIQANPNAKQVSDIKKHVLTRIIERHSLRNNLPRGPKPRPFEQNSRPMPPPHMLAKGNKHIYTALYNTAGIQITGDILDEDLANKLVTFEFIIKNKSKTIGTLKSWKSKSFDSTIESEFSKQQITTSVLIGFFCLGLAVVLSYFGAKRLLAPIKLIILGVENLSNGNYTKALKNKRKDEFGELINNVNRLGATLEQTRSAKNRWFADISHELRTPLTVLMGELEALKLGIRPLSMEQVDSLTQEAHLLKRLIDDLYQLSISDIGALRYEFVDTNLTSLVERLAEQTINQASKTSVTIEQQIQAGVNFPCDENRINQLLTNLVNNSLAYTDPGGTTKISLLTSNNQLHICVEDSAPSLSEAECMKIFEPLYRHNKARTRNAGGAGLGLAICKNIVDAHGGKITAKPSVLGGIQVIVSFPFSPIQAKKATK